MDPDLDNCVVETGAFPAEQELSIGSRVDANGNVTYHVIENDKRAGVTVEKVYDDRHRLTRRNKRAPNGSSETTYEARSGLPLRVFETLELTDGNSLTKEVVYGSDDRSNESVTVVAPGGQLVRRVQREFIGSRTTYQGQTEFGTTGSPVTTVNHHMDEKTGRLMRREQTQWIKDGQRLLTESFSFDCAGGLHKYSKTLYHAEAGPFIQESQLFDSRTQCLIKREIAIFNRAGKLTRSDILTFNDSGYVHNRETCFTDKDGKDIAVANLNR